MVGGRSESAGDTEFRTSFSLSEPKRVWTRSDLVNSVSVRMVLEVRLRPTNTRVVMNPQSAAFSMASSVNLQELS